MQEEHRTKEQLINELVEMRHRIAELEALGTERKQAEEERERLQDQLIRQEKLAALGQLCGRVGHELRNPLGAISNAVYFLNMVLEVPDPEVNETLEILEKEVATSDRIISGLLDFGRARPPTRRQVNINDATRFGDEYNGPQTLKLADLDGNGQINLNDATKFGQIWNGTAGEGKDPDGAGGWNGEGLPPRPPCTCP